MAYQKPEIIDSGPTGDTVEDGITKTDINVDDIYAALNDLLTQIPDDLNPNAYYRVDGSNQLTNNFQAGGFRLINVAEPLEDDEATTKGWSNGQYLPFSGGTVTGLITCSITPTDSYHLANKAYVDSQGGGGGEGVWGSITGDITQQGDLMAEFDKKAEAGHLHLDASTTVAGFMSTADKIKLDDMNDPALLKEFKAFSAGIADAGMPIKLDTSGVLDVSFFSIKIFNLAGNFTPTAGAEYPTPAVPGDYWIIEGVGDLISGGYTFTGGYMAGRVVFDNELMVKGRDDKWGIIHMKIDPRLYYKLDGSNPITADFQAGGFNLKNVKNAVGTKDAVNLEQLNLKEDGLGNPSTSGYVLASSTSGDRSWVPMGDGSTPAPVTSVNGKIGDVILDYDDVGAAASGHSHSTYLPTAGGDMSGMIRMKSASDIVTPLSSGGGSRTIDLSLGTFFNHDNGGSASSYSMSVPSNSRDGLIFLIYLAGSGAKSFSNVVWVGGNAPDGTNGIAVIFSDSKGSGSWLGAWGSMV